MENYWFSMGRIVTPAIIDDLCMVVAGVELEVPNPFMDNGERLYTLTITELLSE